MRATSGLDHIVMRTGNPLDSLISTGSSFLGTHVGPACHNFLDSLAQLSEKDLLTA